MPLLIPTERVTLEMIRDKELVSGSRLAWALEKGYAEAVTKTRQKLTDAGAAALASDVKQRMEMRTAARRPRRR
jgi:hypothetical protein